MNEEAEKDILSKFGFFDSETPSWIVQHEIMTDAEQETRLQLFNEPCIPR